MANADLSCHGDRRVSQDQAQMKKYSFAINVETNDQTGEVMAAYFRVRKGKVAETREYADGAVFADYDRRGELLGIEVLESCKATVLNQITPDTSVRRFFRRSGPRQLVGA
jgi:uncharacterized protein YuzE